ncbi:hypothetical protein LCM23_17015 [Cytobacillus kochii]|uniref:hypothetical protein n=1 Tax=Cytobacillus kochii TaxID=859143 RepID=UPI001CD3804E|nr:hypothetical protein [Cytobacillus kochii]MCA1027798.1 hypothetical protein [Cytobacillus kochii]
MANEMIRMAGRGDDGTAKALKTDNDGNLGVKLTGSTVAKDENGNPVAQAVDLQFNSLTDEEAIPVKSKSLKELVFENITVPAGGSAQLTLTEGSSIDLTDAKEFTMGVITANSHQYRINAQKLDGNSDHYDASTSDRDTIFAEAVRSRALSGVFRVKAPRYKFFLSNTSSAEQTYSIRINKLL